MLQFINYEDIKENSKTAVVYQTFIGNPIIRLILNAIRQIWRFLRFFVVALAWGSPFIMLLGANSYPGAAPDQKLASIVESLEGSLFLAIPIFVTVGLLIVAWPERQPIFLSDASALSLVVLCLFVMGAALFITRELRGVLVVAPVLLGLSMPLVGVLVTAVSLWRRRRWLAGVYIIGFTLTISAFDWLGGRTLATEKDLGAGFVVMGGIGVLLMTSFFGSIISLLITLGLSKLKFGRKVRCV